MKNQVKKILNVSLTLILAFTALGVSVAPASAAVATTSVTFDSPPVAGLLSPAFTLRIETNEIPSDPKRRIGGYQFGFMDSSSNYWPTNYPYPKYLCSSLDSLTCPLESIIVDPSDGSDNYSIPVSSVRDWSGSKLFLISFKESTAVSPSWGNGIASGDVVSLRFRAGAFVVPVDGGIYSNVLYTTYVQFIAEGIYMVGANGLFGTVQGPAATVAAGSVSVPGKPSGLIAEAGNGNATISVGPVANGGSPVSYEIVSQPGGLTCTAVLPATSCTVSGLTAETEYSFKARAINSAGTSAWSDLTPKITAVNAVPGPLEAPIGFSGNASIFAQAVPPTSGGSVYTYYLTAYEGATARGTCSAVAPNTSCVITGLVNGTDYTLKQRAQNGAGLSATGFSAESAVITPSADADTPLGALGAPNVSFSNGIAQVTWAAPETGTAPITYEVVSSPSGANCVITGLSASCTGLTDGTTYHFRVKATNSLGGIYSPVSAALVPVSSENGGTENGEELASTGADASALVSTGFVLTGIGGLFLILRGRRGFPAVTKARHRA